MFKFFKKTKVIKFITMMLVVVFCVNLTGCSEMENDGYNGVTTTKNREFKVGMGANTVGYTVYAESTFDPMTKELFMGYLLSGREFSLVVVPGHKEDETYVFDNTDNYLFSSVQSGVYKYDEESASFVEPSKKALLYYITDDELRDWFNEFNADNNFLNSAMNFLKSGVDVADHSRYTCKKLVNMGSGLSAKDFCEVVLQNKTLTKSNGEIKEKALFSDPLTGGMIVLFGFSAIEGYLTYDDINNYDGSEVANSLANCSRANSSCFNVDSIKAFDIGYILRNYNVISDNIKADEDYDGFTYGSLTGGAAYIQAYTNNAITDVDAKNEFTQKVIQLYTDYKLNHATPGAAKLAATYEMIGSALLTDTGKNSIASLKSSLPSNRENRDDVQNAYYDMIDMIYKFKESAQEEAFNIKLSAALFSRYSSVKDYPSLDSLSASQSYNTIKTINSSNVDSAENYITGNGEEGTYLMLVTADGFVLDRGTAEDQKIAGASEMAGMGVLLSELVRMDACPNATIAAEMFNMLANLKIAAGIALTVAGVSAVAVAATGLAVAAVIAKVAAVSAVTPVPGARIVALVLVAIAGLVAIGAGIYTLFSGLEDKARLKGMGASDTNYCKTYVATFNSLFQSLELSIPVVHYEIPKETEEQYNENLSLKYCDDNGQNCSQIELYYYADVQTTKRLELEGSPMLMYFEKGILRDYIYGAATPAYIVEMLRLWGLLAMREIVYKGQLDWDTNKLSINRTTNTNALTHTIKEAKYCFTVDYGVSVYKEENCVLTSSTTHTQNYQYYKQAGKAYKYYETDIPLSSTLNADAVASMSEYKSKFITSDLYKMNEYIKNNVTMIEPKEIKVSLRFKTTEEALSGPHLKVIDILNENSEVIQTIYNYDVIDGRNGKYYMFESTGNGKAIYYSESLDPTTLNKIATYTNDNIKKFTINDYHEVTYENGKVIFAGIDNTAYEYQSYFDVLRGEYAYTINKEKYYADSSNAEVLRKPRMNPNNKEYELADLLDYINNKLELPAVEVKIPFYLTATVKENTLTQTHSSTDKVCGDNKYLYSRYREFWGTTRIKCLSLDKVTDKDTPLASENDTYYTSSTLAGYVIITMTKGTTDFVATAKYLNEIEE